MTCEVAGRGFRPAKCGGQHGMALPRTNLKITIISFIFSNPQLHKPRPIKYPLHYQQKDRRTETSQETTENSVFLLHLLFLVSDISCLTLYTIV